MCPKVRSLKTKAVLFDLGNTLVRMWTPEIVFHRVLNSLGIATSIEEVEQAITKTEESFKNLSYRSMYGKVSYAEYWDKWDSTVLKHLGIESDEETAEKIRLKWFDHVDCEPYSDVGKVLPNLKRNGLKTGIISTGYEEDIHSILQKSAIQRQLFDVIVGANTIKKEKPHREVFIYALSKLSVKPEETLFIGDTIEADYEGAEKVGIKSILILRHPHPAQRDLDIRTVESLDEIFKFIE